MAFRGHPSRYAPIRRTAIVEKVARSVNPPSVLVGSARGLAGSAALDEPRDPRHGLLEQLVRGRIAGSDVLRARRAERAARDHGDVLLLEEARRERLGIEAGRGDAREGIEGAKRLERLEAHRVEGVDDEPAAP